MKKKLKEMTKDEFNEYHRKCHQKRMTDSDKHTERLKQMREYSKKYYFNIVVKEKQSEYYRILRFLQKFPEILQ